MPSINLNTVTLAGNVTRDAELRYLASGTPVTKASIAVNHRRQHPMALFYPCSAGSAQDADDYTHRQVSGLPRRYQPDSSSRQSIVRVQGCRGLRWHGQPAVLSFLRGEGCARSPAASSAATELRMLRARDRLTSGACRDPPGCSGRARSTGWEQDAGRVARGSRL